MAVSKSTMAVGLLVVTFGVLLQLGTSLKVKISASPHKVIDVTIDVVEPTEQLKELIESKEGIPANTQILKFKGTVLKDDRSLESYGVTDESIVKLCFGSSRRRRSLSRASKGKKHRPSRRTGK